MNVAWGGICCSEPPCVSVAIREATLTYHNLVQNQAFTVGIPSRKQVEVADFVGLVSGRNHDKFQEAGLTALKSEHVNAPIAAELPFTLECQLVHQHKLGLHTIFVGQIMGILADEDILNPKQLPDIEKVQAILYGGFGSNYYYAVGERLGKAFSIGKDLKQETLPKI